MLLLATDGVWDVMESGAALLHARTELVLDGADASLEGESSARSLVERATGKMRSADDTTALVVRITPPSISRQALSRVDCEIRSMPLRTVREYKYFN